MTPSLVCLLPARNAAGDLPRYLESAAGFCDAIVALDDGSTDSTRELLEASPLVEVVLSNPRREGYHGWDDSANRNRLLAAAGELEPDWIISLDTDERIEEDDASALRTFIATDALPGCAFGLQHFRMWGERAYDPDFTWIYRLFAYRPGQVFPDQRLHFDPVPTSIPRAAWLRTTIRVKHLGAMTEELRLARRAKYDQADPGAEWKADYGGLFARPQGELPQWGPRPPDLSVLLGAAGPAPAGPTASEGGDGSREVAGSASSYSGRVVYRNGKAVRPDVAAAFDRMAAAARSEGVSIWVNSGFRSDEEQARMFAKAPDARWTAPPGKSLHRYGTELDLGPPAAYPWLERNAVRFGFARRIDWEPWHYSYTAVEPSSSDVVTEEA